MRQKTSCELNSKLLNIMKSVRGKYKDKRQYKTIIIALTSASKALAEITVEELKDLEIDDE